MRGRYKSEQKLLFAGITDDYESAVTATNLLPIFLKVFTRKRERQTNHSKS